MGKKKFDQNALYELAEQAKGIKMKKKAVQFACCHKDKKGNFRLKPVKDSKNQYLFKCKICKDRKVDLSILNQKEGTIKEQLKAAAVTLKSSADLIKLQSGHKDEKIIAMVVDFEKKLWAYKKLAIKALRANKKGKGKFNKRKVNVTSSGKSLFNRF